MGFHRSTTVEAASEILEGDYSRQLHHFGIRVMLFGASKQLVRDLCRGLCHGFSQLQGNFFGRGEKVGLSPVEDRDDLIIGCIGVASTASVGVYSKGTTDHRCYPDIEQTMKLAG